MQWQTRLLCDCLKRQCPVVRVAAEHRFNERHETDLLAQEGIVLLQDWLLREQWRQRLKFADVPLIEGEEQALQPFVLGARQCVKDGVHELREGILAVITEDENTTCANLRVHQSCRWCHQGTLIC